MRPDLSSILDQDPGDLSASSFEAFYAGQFARLATIGAAVSGDAATGEDLAQDALERVRSRWADVSRYDDPGAWACRVTVNLALNRRRRLANEARALLRLGATVRAAGELPLHGDPAVWRAVAALPLRQRAAVALFYLEDRSVIEIAAVLGVSVSTATSTLHQARRRLARDLAGVGPVHDERIDRR